MNVTLRPSGRLPYRRAGVVYLLAILVPALALCYLGLSSIDRERQALDTMAANNALLTAEHFVADVETRARALAEACLRDPDLARIGSLVYTDSPTVRRQARAVLDRVGASHPIAGALVLFRGGRLLLPEATSQPPRRLEQLLTGQPAATREQFAAFFAEAEALEVRALQPAAARSRYQRASELAVSDELRALAIARVARCAARANDEPGAVNAYRTLLARFPDQYDLANWPYGIVAALQLDERGRGAGASKAATLTVAQTSLASGRWELSAEAATYLRQSIAARLGQVQESPAGRYFDYLALAERLQDRARPPNRLKAGDITPVTPAGDDDVTQIFYARAGGEPGGGNDLVIGLVINLVWVESELLPETARDLKLSLLYHIARTPVAVTSRPEATATLFVPFKHIFPFWAIEIPPVSITERGGMLLFAGTTLVVLAVLVLGVVLLVRDASREGAMARLRSGFVSGVSHELKTPLTLIRMYGEMLRDDPDASADDRQVYSGIITRESERLTRLIDRVLDFSRAERGTRQYRLKRVGLAPVIQATLDEYVPYLRQRGFALESQIGEVAPVEADADAVREAVVNLLDNAAKYSGEARDIAVRLIARPGEVVAEVRDRGIGIDDRTRARLFLPFERGDHQDGMGGHGLGLYLVKQIMDAHGGRVEVDTVPGRGSAFRLVFPASPLQGG